MPQLIDKPQLHATAQVAKSYILEKGNDNVNTIINALQQGGDSSPTPDTPDEEEIESKAEPTLEMTILDGRSGSFSYNGDGDIFGYVEGEDPGYSVRLYLYIDRENEAFEVRTDLDSLNSFTVYLHATETDNYTAATASLTCEP